MRSHSDYRPAEGSVLVRNWMSVFESFDMKLNLIQFQGHGLTNDDESSLIALDLSS